LATLTKTRPNLNSLGKLLRVRLLKRHQNIIRVLTPHNDELIPR
jgi:hypothetical protein